MALVELSRVGSVSHLVINRPEAKNALNRGVIHELLAALDALEGDERCKVVLLYGAGSEAFCAGADLRELLEIRLVGQRTEFFSDIAMVIRRLNQLSKPVIAKVHGFALAGGCGLVAAADIVVCSDDAVFGLPEVNIGLVPMVVMAPLSRVLSRRTLAQLVLTGERIGSQRALQIGLVSEVYPKVALDGEAEKLAVALSGKSRVALQAAKAALYQVPEQEYFSALDELPRRIGALSVGDEAKEGIRAFIEKRAPQWK